MPCISGRTVMGGPTLCPAVPCAANAIATTVDAEQLIISHHTVHHATGAGLKHLVLTHTLCRRSNNSGFSVGGGGGFGNAGPRIWFSPLDVFWYLDPYYMRRRRLRQENGQGMNFLEAIFSFVFGDGNPNESYEDRRWRLVRHHCLCFLDAGMLS